MAWYPSGKGSVCKTLMQGFDSPPGLIDFLKNFKPPAGGAEIFVRKSLPRTQFTIVNEEAKYNRVRSKFHRDSRRTATIIKYYLVNWVRGTQNCNKNFAFSLRSNLNF